MNIKRNCIFLLDKEKEKPDSKLRYRIKWDGNTVAFNVGYRVDNNKWVAEAQRCKPNTTHGKKKISAATINSEINRLEEIVNDTFFFFEQTGHIPTSSEFRNEVNKRNGKIVEKEEKTFFDYYQQFIIEQGKENSWSENTYKRHKTTMNHLKKFAPDLTFADLTHEGLSRLVDYFMSIEVDNETGMKNYTAKKYINLAKWFLKWASEKGYNKELSFVTFKEKLKTIPAKVIFLEWNELMSTLDDLRFIIDRAQIRIKAIKSYVLIPLCRSRRERQIFGSVLHLVSTPMGTVLLLTARTCIADSLNIHFRKIFIVVRTVQDGVLLAHKLPIHCRVFFL